MRSSGPTGKFHVDGLVPHPGSLEGLQRGHGVLHGLVVDEAEAAELGGAGLPAAGGPPQRDTAEQTKRRNGCVRRQTGGGVPPPSKTWQFSGYDPVDMGVSMIGAPTF